nr:MAG TPA: hypothetical protein [Caudoviricetes sp.]
MVGIFCTRSSIIPVNLPTGLTHSQIPQSPAILVANPFIPPC